MTIYKALKHQRLKENIARNGSQRVRGLFTWSAIAQQLVAAVEEYPAVLTATVKENGHKAFLF